MLTVGLNTLKSIVPYTAQIKSAVPYSAQVKDEKDIVLERHVLLTWCQKLIFHVLGVALVS